MKAVLIKILVSTCKLLKLYNLIKHIEKILEYANSVILMQFKQYK